MSLALQLPPHFLAPSLRSGRSLTLLLPLLGDFLLRGIRGGGWRHSHATVRKRNTDPQKLFKEQKHINNCQACGRPKLIGHMCMHCVTYLTRLFKATRRAGLDRPTLDQTGQLIAPIKDLERLPEAEWQRYQKSVAYREQKYRKLKQEFEEEEAANLRQTNARRAILNLTPLNEAGKVPLNPPPSPRRSISQLMSDLRDRLPSFGRSQ